MHVTLLNLSFWKHFGVRLLYTFGLMAAAPLVGQISPVALVNYSPVIREIQGQIPFAETYTLQITSPSNTPAGTSITVVFEKSVNGFKPVGVTDAEALSFLTFSQNALTFTGPNQTQGVTVTFAVPASAAGGSYGYQVKTVGWPATLGAMNNGTSINATVSVAATPSTPVVTISTPPDGHVVTVTSPSTAFPVSIPFQFTAVSSDANGSAITGVDADLNGNHVVLTTSGLNSTSVSASGTLQVTQPGSYVITARATNASGTASDTNGFVVRIAVAAPSISIQTPLLGTTYTYRQGQAPVNVPLAFTATSGAGGIQSLSATLDGIPLSVTSANLLTSVATGTTVMPLDADDAGKHVVEVSATDIYGQIAVARTEFTLTVLKPSPAVAISNPTPSQVFTLPAGATTMNIPYRFVSTTTNGFVVESVQVQLDGTVIATSGTTGLGTALATSTGTLASLGVGTYTLEASATSGGISAGAEVQFIVKAAAQMPPSVVISSPAIGATYNLASDDGSIRIPVNFTGTSTVAGGTIIGVTARFESTPLSVSARLNEQVVNASSTITVSRAGTYTVTVTATDAVGTATASRTFTVKSVTPRSVAGLVYFDADRDASYDGAEFGLSGIAVRLINAAGQMVASATTNAGGLYTFASVSSGNYSVVAVPYTGLNITTGGRVVTVENSNTRAASIGMGLDFNSLRGLKADGKSHGFWKSNLEKAISGKTNGSQVSASAVKRYTEAIGDFALAPYDSISLKAAVGILGSSSSQPADLLSKQLIASEYNYQNGAYLNGNRQLTLLFVYWGEQLLARSAANSSSTLLWAKDWFDAYNNSHGGSVDGPR